MSRRPRFSLIVPTRQRPARLRRFLDSVRATASRPEALEVVLVVDADDPASRAVRHDGVPLRHVVVPPGLTMGALNGAGYEASAGDHVMLLNDDVVVHTRGWDDRVLACLRRFPDDIVLVHVNDTVFRDRLCIFPLVSRTFCTLAGGVCPRAYVRYRIDDHIEDVFNLLAVLGKRRTVYLPDVVFEHLNTVARPQGDRVYASDPEVLAHDGPLFDALFPARKELACRLLAHIHGRPGAALPPTLWYRLAEVTDPFLLRVPGRQRVDWSARWRLVADRVGRPGGERSWARALHERAHGLMRRRGYRGLVQALGRLLLSGGLRRADLHRMAWEARYPAREEA